MENGTEVSIVNVDIPFGRLVMLLVKVSLAAIPAAIILAFVWLVLVGVLGGIFAGLGRS